MDKGQVRFMIYQGAQSFILKTHHIINGEMLALMKPSAYLINVTRGLNIDQTALIFAQIQLQTVT